MIWGCLAGHQPPRPSPLASWAPEGCMECSPFYQRGSQSREGLRRSHTMKMFPRCELATILPQPGVSVLGKGPWVPTPAHQKQDALQPRPRVRLYPFSPLREAPCVSTPILSLTRTLSWALTSQPRAPSTERRSGNRQLGSG